MRVVAGAFVILTGTVRVVAHAVQLTAGEQANIHLPGVEALMPAGSLVCFVGLVLLVSGLWESRPHEPRQ